MRKKKGEFANKGHTVGQVTRMFGEVHQARDAGVDLVTSQVTPPGCAGGSSRGCSPPLLPPLPAYAGEKPSGWELWMLPVEPVAPDVGGALTASAPGQGRLCR